MFLFTIPQWGSNSFLTLVTIIGITVISAHGLNILTGNCGLVSLGHSGFMMVGGYAMAILTHSAGLPFWAALPVAGLAAGVIGISLVYFVAGQGFLPDHGTGGYFIIPRLVLQFRSITGGTEGLSVPPADLFGWSLRPKANYFYVVMVLAILATIVAKNILRTRAGRAFVAIRDNDLAAEVMGVNLFSYKLQAFFIGNVFAGLGGALSVQYYSFANVEQFPFFDSVWLLGMLIVGGMGSVSGTIYGVIAIKLDTSSWRSSWGRRCPRIANPQTATGLKSHTAQSGIILFLKLLPVASSHIWNVEELLSAWPYNGIYPAAG